jgi:hypothetical protein
MFSILCGAQFNLLNEHEIRPPHRKGSLSEQPNNPAAQVARLAVVMVHRQDGLAIPEGRDTVYSDTVDRKKEQVSEKFLLDRIGGVRRKSRRSLKDR